MPDASWEGARAVDDEKVRDLAKSAVSEAFWINRSGVRSARLRRALLAFAMAAYDLLDALEETV